MKRRQPMAMGSMSALLEHEAELRDGLQLPPATEKKRLQIIHPLHEDPVLLTLTPRSLARSVAELDLLRGRVLELEQKLSQHDVELLPSAATPGKSKLPPLPPGEAASASASATATASDSVITTTELLVSRKPIAAPLVLVAASPAKSERIVDPPSPTTSVISTSSPQKEQAKMTLEPDGDARFATSQRQRLYQILKRVTTLVAVAEDDLVVLKKLVDAEVGDVIAFLLAVELLDDAALLREKLSVFLKTGSPSKQKSVAPRLPRHHPVWSIQYPLQKIAHNLEALRSSSSSASSHSSASGGDRTDVIVLVSSGAYNPIHMLHIRAFYVARQFVESNYQFPVVGAFISPSHDTFVRVKNRRNPHEMITKRHRLGLIEAAVASSSWIEVDKWEITRRRVLDYLSTLTHVREMCESHFPQFKFHLVYVCGCNTVVKLSHSALKGEGFGCITVCRPTQTEMVAKHLGKTLAKSTTIVEDTGVLPHELERATSFRARQAMGQLAASQDPRPMASLEMMVGKPVLQYMLKHAIPLKVTGKEAWSEDDKAWRHEDLAYVEYIEG